MKAAGKLVLADVPEELACRLRETNSTLSGADGELVIAFAKDFRDPALLRFLYESRPVLFIGTFMSKPVLGPIQLKGRSVCVGCLHYWALAVNESLPSSVELASAASPLAHVADGAIAEFVSTGTIRRLERAFLTIECRSGIRTLHPVVTLSNCQFCSRPNVSDLKTHCSPLTGLVSRLQRTSLPVAGVYYACSTYIDPPAARVISCNEPNVSWGKGLSPSQAENSCIAEAVESYSLRHRGDESVARATLAAIRGIDPKDILMISKRQYQDRETINRRSSRFFIPEPFNPALPIDWLGGTNLIDGAKVFVPAACCLTGYRFVPEDAQFCRADGSGCASGRSLTEATLSALYECVERDALGIWWYNRANRPRVLLEAAGEKKLLSIENELRRIGRRLIVLDITTDFAIPTYVAVTAQLNGTLPVFGSASDISPRVALMRALTESVLNWFIASKNPADVDIRDWLLTARLKEHPYLQGCGIKLPRPEPVQMNPRAQLEYTVSRLAGRGFQPVMTDLTRSEALLNTVRVLVPGLRTFKPWYSAGRLYDVPVQLKWQSGRLAESELNPFCVF